MGQEISVSYQAVKSKVYRLIDSLVEDAKTQGDVQESMKRWWKHIHPACAQRAWLASTLCPVKTETQTSG